MLSILRIKTVFFLFCVQNEWQAVKQWNALYKSLTPIGLQCRYRVHVLLYNLALGLYWISLGIKVKTALKRISQVHWGYFESVF